MKKYLEIRDSMTFIPALAIEINGSDSWIARRAGYAKERYILLIELNSPRCQYDPYEWPSGTRTMPISHKYIEDNWDSIEDGDVIDVEFILGKTKEKKQSEQYEIAK